MSESPRTKIGARRVALFLGMVLAIVALAIFGPSEEEIFQKQDQLRAFVESRPLTCLVLFIAVEVILGGLSIPSGAGLSVLAGVLFGRWLGIAAVGIGNGLGALLAFLLSRYLFRDLIVRLAETRPRLKSWLDTVDAGVTRSGAYYLFLIRMTLIVPYFVLNFACGLTRMRAFTFWWVTQLSILPVMFVWVNVGAAVGDVRSTSELVSWKVGLSLGALALFPWLMHGVVWVISRVRRMPCG